MPPSLQVVFYLIAGYCLVVAVRGLFTGRLRVKRGVIKRSEYPLLFYTMFCVYLFCVIAALVCLSGNLMTLINLTI